MIMMHCTYPDGSTFEARFGLKLDDAIACYDPLYDYDARTWDRVSCDESADEDWDPITLGGEG